MKCGQNKIATRVYFGHYFMAPGMGFEPMTNGLHVSPGFPEGWTISSSLRMRGASANRCVAYSLRIVSEPSRHSGSAADYPACARASRQFTPFSFRHVCRKLLFGPTSWSQSTALPLSYPGTLLSSHSLPWPLFKKCSRRMASVLVSYVSVLRLPTATGV